MKIFSELILVLITIFSMVTGADAFVGRVKICDTITPNRCVTINEDGRLDCTQHAHPDATSIHFHLDDIGAGTSRFILIDLSNTGTGDANYKHVGENYIHIEWIQVEVDGSATAEFSISLGFLEAVNGTDGDRYLVKHWSGTRTAGQSFRLFESPYPNGWQMSKESIATHGISIDDVNYSNLDTYGDTLNPAGSVGCGVGDVILEVTVAGGGTPLINLGFDIGYHSH